MRGLPVLAGLLLALAACGGETVTVTTTVVETETETETVAETETVEQPIVVGLPGSAAATHAALLQAARAGDYEALRPLVPQENFSYTFGTPDPEGPIAYWQRLEEESDESPLEILARILELPYTLSAGTYVWPFAYDKQAEQLTDYESELLGDLAESFLPETGYLGWRAGIDPNGRWQFFIAGD
ncbi:MAG TPA: hypothetical protein VK915_05555 [Gaiellaceae bacterium]|nr:hypothetical protein [Gaiellaceae bacterium]